MESSEDKQWATKYLLDPLTAPEPSDETGPGTHYRSTFAPKSEFSGSNDENERVFVKSRESNYPNPPTSASPRQSHFIHRKEVAPSLRLHSHSSNRTSSEIPTSTAPSSDAGRPRSIMNGASSSDAGGPQRRSSLTERFPGDRSYRPLDIIRQDVKKANRAPHLRKKHHIGADSIDRLDSVGGSYHHDGPFDATMLARNTAPKSSPVQAVAASNEEALKATPYERVVDSIQRRRPLEGVAIFPAGMPDPDGRVLNYEEGVNLDIEAGFKRWPGVAYHPDDLKAKGEPSYTIEKALKAHKAHRRNVSENNQGVELTPRRRPVPIPRPRSSGSATPSRLQAPNAGTITRAVSGDQPTSRGDRPASNGLSYAEWESLRGGQRASGNVITRRFGSLRRRDRGNEHGDE